MVNGQWVDVGMVLASKPASKAKEESKQAITPAEETPSLIARVSGEATVKGKQIFVSYTETEEREYMVPGSANIWVKTGDTVKAGQQLTDGSVNPHDILRILGKEAVQQYMVDEVQKVYRSQGVNINDKHIEVIARQMLTRVRIDSAGDTQLVPDELVDKAHYEDINARVLAEGGEPATAHTILLGITRASLSTDSWLAAASFQETTRILTEAAVSGKVDKLIGLKENVIIGKLIPARFLSEEETPELTVGEQSKQILPPLESEGEEDLIPSLLDDKLVPEDEIPNLFADKEEEEPEADLQEQEEPEANGEEEKDTNQAR